MLEVEKFISLAKEHAEKGEHGPADLYLQQAQWALSDPENKKGIAQEEHERLTNEMHEIFARIEPESVD